MTSPTTPDSPSIDALRFAPSKRRKNRFVPPAAGHRDWYAYEALSILPRIITLIDKNRLSATYGCCDREFWHYRTVDFPCQMSQEFCLPLALAYAHPFPNNPYFKVERIRDLAIAIIDFARKETHSDGSVDDYFPFERALGAHVFSTYAITETYIELGLDRPELISFFRKRGDWLVDNNESGQLTNHQFYAALALYNVYLLTGDQKYLSRANDFRDIALSWQNDEGWFQEYEGADPGYHSVSIALLAKLHKKSGDDALIEPMRRAVRFAHYFMHPDGSYAGEYGSRNTYHFYPHGFEYMAPHMPEAAWVAETFLRRAMPERRRYYNEDNRMISHYVLDWMHSWLDYHPERQGTLAENRKPFTKHFKEAGILVKKTDSYYAVVNATKGGVVKVFDVEGPIYSDTGVMLRTSDGTVMVSHLVDEEHLYDIDAEGGVVTVTGKLSKRRYPLSSPVKQILFRGMNLSVGRFGAHLVRQILQKVLITGKPRTEATFTRRLVLGADDVTVDDTLDIRGVQDVTVADVVAGSDATSIYVANSNTFQESVLLPWHPVSAADVHTLNSTGRLELPQRRALDALRAQAPLAEKSA